MSKAPRHGPVIELEREALDAQGLEAATAAVHADIGYALSMGALWAEFEDIAYHAVAAYLQATNENGPTEAGS